MTPRSALRLAATVAAAAGRTAGGHLRGRPLVPGWGPVTELLARSVAGTMDRALAHADDPERVRAILHGSALPGAAHRKTRSRQTTMGGVPVVERWPRAADPADLPTLLYFHGGGYVFGSPAMYAEHTSRLALAAGARLLVPDYRLAPEHPFPAGPDDCLAVYRAVLGEGTDPARLVVAGDSAGGGLTASTLIAARDAGLPLAAGGVLICPWLDLAATHGTIDEYGGVDFTDRRGVERFAELFLQGRAPKEDPRASPLYGDPSGLPPLLIQAGGVEILRGETEAFAAKAEAAGVDTNLHVYPGMFHVWHFHAGLLAEGRAAIAEIGAFVGARTAG